MSGYQEPPIYWRPISYGKKSEHDAHTGYDTRPTLAEAAIMACQWLDHMRPNEELGLIEFCRQGNDLIYPGWYVRMQFKRTVGSVIYERKDPDRRWTAYRMIIAATRLAAQAYPEIAEQLDKNYVRQAQQGVISGDVETRADETA